MDLFRRSRFNSWNIHHIASRLRYAMSSLRFRLSLLVLLAVLPAFGLTFSTHLEQRQQEVAHIQTDALRLTRLAANSQAQLTENTQQLLMTLAQLPQLREPDLATCNATLSSVRKINQSYTNLGVIDRQGNLICSALPINQWINQSQQLWFQQALKINNFFVGEYQINPTTHTSILNLSYPIRDQTGEVTGIVYADLELSWLNQLAKTAQLPPGTTFIVIDQNGLILARDPYPETWVGKFVTHTPLFRAILKQKREGIFQVPGLDGVQRLYAFTPLKSMAQQDSLYISVGIPKQVALAEINQTLTHNLIGLGFVAAIVVVTAWVGSNLFILRWVEALLRATRRLAAGDMSARTGGMPPDLGELGQLAYSFDRMANSLEQTMREREQLLEQLNQETSDLAALVTVTTNAISTLNLDELLQVLLQRIVEVTQADTAVILLKEDDQLVMRAGIGIDEEIQLGHAVPIGSNFAGIIAMTLQPLYIEDVQTDPSVMLSQFMKRRSIRTMLGVPLKRHGNLIGVLHVDWFSIHAYSDRELHLLEITAERCAMAILNAQLYEDVQKREELYRILSQNFPNGVVFLFDHDLRYTLAEGAGLADLGLSQDFFVGKTIWEILPPETCEIVEPNYRAALAGVATCFEMTYGDRFYLVHTLPVRNDQAKIFAGMVVTQDISDRKLAEEALAKRERYLAGLVEVQRQLLVLEDEENYLSKILEPLGQAAGACRVYVFENHRDLEGNLLMSQRAEWCAPGIKPEINNLALQNLPYAAFFPRWAQILSQGESVTGIVEEFPESERLILMPQKILSILVLPLFVHGEFFGFIGFDNCIEARPWEASEVALLRATAAALSLAQERRQAKEALLKANERFHLAATAVNSIIYDWDVEQETVERTEGLFDVLGYHPEEAEPTVTWWRARIHPDEQQQLQAQIKEALAHESFYSLEYRVRDKNEQYKYVWDKGRIIRNPEKRGVRVVGSTLDITDRKRAEEALRESERRYHTLAKVSPVGIFHTDAQGDCIYVNKRWCEMSGLTLEESLGQGWLCALHPEDRERIINQWVRTVLEGWPFKSEYRFQRPDGVITWVFGQAIADLGENGELLGYVGTITDISERKLAEEQLRQNAFYDSLTGLFNRAFFLECLANVIEQAKQEKDHPFAVLFLDLNRFAIVKYSLGHLVADQLLVVTAQRIQLCLRPSDIAARVGLDEFTILLADISQVSDAISIAEKIHQQLTLPFNLDGREVFVTASMGIALGDYSDPAVKGFERPEDFLRAADTAMNQAKKLGQLPYTVFEPTMHARAVARLQLDTDLRRAIERQEFQLHYQPIVSLSTRKIIGFEALVRWQHPQRGMVSPAEFIPLTEETGLIIPLGQWVLLEACRQLRVWQQKFPTHPPLSMSVNLSGVQFRQPNLIEQIDQILQESNVNPGSLKLEITESVVMDNAESATAILQALKARNIQLAMDDFGTGYSSLSYLHRFPVDTLKIDRSFVSLMDVEGGNLEIVRTITTLAHYLGMDLIAEGIETEAQLGKLQELQCEYGQGYFFSRPVNSEAAEQLLKTT